MDVYFIDNNEIKKFIEEWEVKAIWLINEDDLIIAHELGINCRSAKDWSLKYKYSHDEVILKYKIVDSHNVEFSDFNSLTFLFDFNNKTVIQLSKNQPEIIK